MDPVHKEIGSMIRAARKLKKWTMLDLAKKLGYESMQFVSLFERGLSKVPHEVIGKCIKLLDLPEKKIVKMIVQNEVQYMDEQIKEGKKEYALRHNQQ